MVQIPHGGQPSTPAPSPAPPGPSPPSPRAWAPISSSSPCLCVTWSLRGCQPPPPAGHPTTQPSLQPVSRRIASPHAGNLAWMTLLPAEIPGPAASSQGLWSPRRARARRSPRQRRLPLPVHAPLCVAAPPLSRAWRPPLASPAPSQPAPALAGVSPYSSSVPWRAFLTPCLCSSDFSPEGTIHPNTY